MDFLLECLKIWPASHALLRSIELRKLWRYPLKGPVLDVGCGDGTFARFLFDPPMEAGIDLNADEVTRAQKNGMYRHALCVSATQLPFPDKSFANVFSNCVLEHIDGLDAALAEISRVMKPGGALLTTVPHPRWESDGPLPILRRMGMDTISEKMNNVLRKMWHHVTVQDQDAWRPRLNKAGLKLVVWEPYMVPPAYAAYARYLPSSFGSFFWRRLTGRWLFSKTLRSFVAPILASRLRGPFLAEDTIGACSLFMAVKSR